MKRNCVQNVIIHIPENMDFHAFSDKINEFHLEVVERRLNNSNLTTDEKIAVIDKILDSQTVFNGTPGFLKANV